MDPCLRRRPLRNQSNRYSSNQNTCGEPLDVTDLGDAGKSITRKSREHWRPSGERDVRDASDPAQDHRGSHKYGNHLHRHRSREREHHWATWSSSSPVRRRRENNRPITSPAGWCLVRSIEGSGDRIFSSGREIDHPSLSRSGQLDTHPTLGGEEKTLHRHRHGRIGGRSSERSEERRGRRSKNLADEMGDLPSHPCVLGDTNTSSRCSGRSSSRSSSGRGK